jgi:hypothetical protein
MENKNQMQSGTWDKMGTEDYKPEDKIKFEVNIAQKVIILNPIPKECIGDDGGVYYAFEVEQDKKPKIIQTSAWTLLKELKKANIKAGMQLEIIKKLVKGKQFFEVKVFA